MGQSIQETADAIELAVTNAADEILKIASDPSRVIGLIETVIEAGEVSSEKMGDAIADKLIEFSKQPSAVIGKQLGRAPGNPLRDRPGATHRRRRTRRFRREGCHKSRLETGCQAWSTGFSPHQVHQTVFPNIQKLSW